MRARLHLGVLAILMVLTLTFAPLEAQEKKDSIATDKKKVETDPVADLATAHYLADYGRNTKSPEALIAAAGILQRMQPVKMLDVKAESSTEADPKKITKSASEPLPDLRAEAADLLAEAKKLSANDPHVVALADALAGRPAPAASTRGAADSPRMYVKPINPGGTDYFTIPVQPGFPMQLAVIGQGNARLRVNIWYRATIDGVVTSDVPLGASNGVMGRIGFMAPAADSMTLHVTIRNLGKAPTAYRLITN
jgi:hypothetical protein